MFLGNLFFEVVSVSERRLFNWLCSFRESMKNRVENRERKTGIDDALLFGEIEMKPAVSCRLISSCGYRGL